MANLEYVTKLKEGVQAWNAWRDQNPYIFELNLSGVNLESTNLNGANLCHVNFDGAELGGVNLHGANLRWANLTKANLTEANLTEANLNHTNLTKVNLRGTNLTEANLHGANLTEVNFLRENFTRSRFALPETNFTNLVRANFVTADLTGADLTGADLTGADLTGASLERANLTEANLFGADLCMANLTEANLNGVNFAGVHLYGTIFADVDLTTVKGLESCVHKGPSTIDHRTLARSGNLPLSFLRGCGLPDTFIDYLPSLLNQPIQHYSCFISYSSKDDAFAQRLYADLQNKGVRCWFAPKDMKIGDKLWDTIDKAIQLRDKVLLILSRQAIGSDWVEDEVTKAYAEERRRKQTILFPIRIDNTVIKTGEPWAVKLRDGRHIGDFCQWESHDKYQQSLGKLLRDLKIEKGK